MTHLPSVCSSLPGRNFCLAGPPAPPAWHLIWRGLSRPKRVDEVVDVIHQHHVPAVHLDQWQREAMPCNSQGCGFFWVSWGREAKELRRVQRLGGSN